MIPADILFRLVPDHDPEDDFPRDPRLLDFDPESPGRRIGLWAAYLRHRINRTLVESTTLRELVERSGYLATGVFKVPEVRQEKDFPGFEIVEGYRFGAVLLRGVPRAETESLYVFRISLESGRYAAPILQTLANFNPHLASQDGYAAAHFKDGEGDYCGITAAHVTNNYRPGQRVPVLCAGCGASARLKRRAPGLIDAAAVKFRCGGPGLNSRSNTPLVRSAIEGETVETHFGDSGKKLCTVMLSLQTDAQIKCAAAPKHFLIDIHGNPGDSGSLVSEKRARPKERDLIGMYLGETECEDANLNYVTYGYALDLKQAADLLGASNLQGEFND